MKQQIAVITIGVSDLDTSKKFYVDGFGWKPEFENEEIVFYQMNGFVFGTFLESSLAKDANRKGFMSPGAFSLAHNVPSKDDVEPTISNLIASGGKLLRTADEPPQGGYRGYVADPDDHTWEIAWNPAFPIDENGLVKFKAP